MEILDNEKQKRTVKFAQWVNSLSLADIARPDISTLIKRFARVILEDKNGGDLAKAVVESGLLNP